MIMTQKLTASVRELEPSARVLFLDLHSRHRLHLHHIRTPLILRVLSAGPR